MGSQNKLIFLSCILIIAIFMQVLSVERLKGEAQEQFSGGIRVYGLVNTPTNLSDADLSSMPKVSEVAVIKCVWGNPADVTVNWTGIPLFHILTLAGIKPEAIKVVFRSRPPDTFSSALKVEDAFNTTILIATEANGVPLTSLSEIVSGHKGGYRIVVPGRYGYKWVANVGSIEVVDYDYLGTYESPSSQGGLDMSDTAFVPELAWTTDERAYLPATIVPPLETFTIPYGNRSFQVQAFTNVSASGFHFDSTQKSIGLNFIVPDGSAGFVNVIIQQTMIVGPYQTFVDAVLASVAEANVSGLDFQYVAFAEGMHALMIVGTEFLGNVPTIVVAPFVEPVYVGSAVVFDARNSQDQGTIVAFMWNFGDGMSGSGAVVSHVYNRTGTFTVAVNAVDNFGGMSSISFDVTVQKQPIDVLVLLGVGFAVATIIAVIAFITLLSKRRKRETGQRIR